MILSFAVAINDIVKLGRRFPWPRPANCPRCRHHPVWGHGFVLAFFDGLSEGVWLRRWRCPECGGVHRARPTGYFPRFQASLDQIRSRLSIRLKTGFWPPGLSRSRQGHWLRGLKRRVTGFFGLHFCARLLEGFDRLVLMGRIPVSRSI